MTPLKVICFLFDPNVGGPTIRARMVYRVLRAEGYDVRVAFPDQEGTAAAYMAEQGIPTDRLPIAKPVLPRKIGPFLRFVGTAPLSLWRLWRYLRRERPDVIHVNGAFDILPALAGRLAGVPVVWHLNDTVFNPRLSALLGRCVQAIATEVVVAASRVGAHYGVPKARSHVIFAPADTARFPARPPQGWPRPQPVLTLLGNWNWIKGQDRFVDVVAGLRAKGLNVRGQVAGKFLEGQKDFWEPIVADIAARDLGDVVTSLGFVEDTPALLAQSDVLLITSHSEASPISLLEAMSVGVPVVTFDVGGVREMLGEGAEQSGIVVPAGDVAAMTEAVAGLLQDPAAYRRLSLAAQNRVRAGFSAEACILRHKCVYAVASGTDDRGDGQ